MESVGKCKGKIDQMGEAEEAPLVFVISSDDEEQNEDPSIEIVEKVGENVMRREYGEDFDGFEENEAQSVLVIDICSSSSDGVEIIDDMGCVENAGEAVAMEERRRQKKKKRRKTKKRRMIEEDGERADDSAMGEMPVETFQTVEVEAVETLDNVVLRKLLRGPRYFDPSNGFCETCHNCNEEGHSARDCTVKRKKACFVCGKFGHSAKHCTEVNECSICKRRGHLLKDCVGKQGITQNTKMCLQCGDLGHDMFSCTNDYAPAELKEIQCYICKSYGHLCCVDIDIGPKEVFCYNCGQSGHTGIGCARPRGEISSVRSPILCYKCGEDGHFARGCLKYSSNFIGGNSTPTQEFSREGRDFSGFKTLPHDFREAHKKKYAQYEGRYVSFARKTWRRGGSLTNNPGELPNKKFQENHWKSSIAEVKKEHNVSTLASAGNLSSSQHPIQKKPGFLSSSVSIKPHPDGFST